ncbi:hypothetical protein R1sor_020676 [Riccia sorocarpa]|uniref:Uncharacterized protein n=1 Tax=Riccia sorocarpa TaxID=122646 RepID=A0ABD3GI06_9MARC
MRSFPHVYNGNKEKQQIGSSDQSKQSSSSKQVTPELSVPIPEQQIERQASKSFKRGGTPTLDQGNDVLDRRRADLREDLDDHSVGSPLHCLDKEQQLSTVNVAQNVVNVPNSKRLVILNRSRLSEPITARRTPLSFIPNWVTDEVEGSGQNTEEDAEDFQAVKKKTRVENGTLHMDSNTGFLPDPSIAP